MEQELLSFLQKQKIMAIASPASEPLVTNVFYAVDQDLSMYFVGDRETPHSQHVLSNPLVAYSVAWFHEDTFSDRKGMQAKGMCTLLTDLSAIERGIYLHNASFPDFADDITIDFIQSEESTSGLWKIKPSYIKYWDDELLSEGHVKEFTF